MSKPDEYLAIRAWGEMMHTAPSFIVADQERAAQSNAPIDSIYFTSRQWITVAALTNPDARRSMEERLEGLRSELKR